MEPEMERSHNQEKMCLKQHSENKQLLHILMVFAG